MVMTTGDLGKDFWVKQKNYLTQIFKLDHALDGSYLHLFLRVSKHQGHIFCLNVNLVILEIRRFGDF